MAGLVPPARAEALWPALPAVAPAGEGPAIHVFTFQIKFVDARHVACARAGGAGPEWPGMTNQFGRIPQGLFGLQAILLQFLLLHVA